jgi:hypothetical protein
MGINLVCLVVVDLCFNKNTNSANSRSSIDIPAFWVLVCVFVDFGVFQISKNLKTLKI